MNNNKNWDLLVFFCGLAISNKNSNTQFDVKSVYWDELYILAMNHRVRPLLHIGISKWAYKDFIPNEFQQKLKDFRLQKSTFDLMQTKELIRFLQIFESKDISVVPYKGVVFAHSVFGNIGAREFSDLDLMIRKKDLKALMRIFKEHNYIVESTIPDFFWKNYINISCEFNFDYFKNEQRIYHFEPHWTIGKPYHQLNINYTDLESFIVKDKFFNNNINTYSPEGTLLTTCLHHIGKESYFGLKHICDVYAILTRFEESFNWSLLVSESERLKVKNIVLIGISTAHQVFDMKLPTFILEQINSDKIKMVTEQQLGLLFENNFEETTVFDRMWKHISMRAHWSTKIKIIYYHIRHLSYPMMHDFPNQEVSFWNYYTFFIKKSYGISRQFLTSIIKQFFR